MGVLYATLVIVVLRTLPSVITLPTEGVIVYPVITTLPYEAGAVQDSNIVLPPTKVAVTAVGGGGVNVTADEAGEEAEDPLAFVAFTVNVMAVPVLKPVSVVVKTLPTVTAVPTEGVTIYPVIGNSAVGATAVQDTVADASPATNVGAVGAEGNINVIADEAGEASEFPLEFEALTVNVMAIPAVKLLSVVVKTLPTVTSLP
jgi:hypothetical protein